MNQVLHAALLKLARAKKLAAYSDVAPLVGLVMDDDADRDKIACLLAEIAISENGRGHPMLTALIVHKGRDNNPGPGFFDIAQELGHFDGTQDPIKKLTFWANQVTEVHNFWSAQNKERWFKTPIIC